MRAGAERGATPARRRRTFPGRGPGGLRRRALPSLLALFALFPSGARGQDVVRLHDGTTLTGRVMYADRERVVLRDERRDRELDAAEVAELDTIRTRVQRLLKRAAAVGPSDPRRNQDLALFARSVGLEGEAAVFHWRTVLADPTNAQAHAALGHVEARDYWRIDHDRRRYRGLADLREATAEWKHAFELSTAHFELRTNLPLEQAVEIAIDLERFYEEFYSLWQEALGLYECTERMQVHAHADSKSFPEGRGGSASYFDPGPNTLFLNASVQYRREVLSHEGSHQLFYNATRLDPAFSADFPAWLDEGIAEYLAAATVQPPAPFALVPGTTNLDHYASFINADRPLSLSRVLSLQLNDFHNNTKTYLMYAQSFALVHYCLHGEGGTLREPFLAYVRACIDGRSSPTAFKKVLEVDRYFEERWLEFAHFEVGR